VSKRSFATLHFDDDITLKPTAERSDKKHTHMLSDGVARVFFQPSVIGTASGVHDTSSCIDICMALYVNVVLSSGTAMFQRICDGVDSNHVGGQVFAPPE